MFKRLLSLSFIVVSVFLVGCKNQITDTPKQEDYTPINLSGQYEVSFVGNSENYINQVNIKTKNYDSWSVTGIELDSTEFFTGSIIGSMYYFPGSGYIFFTMQDGPFGSFTRYQYYTSTKQLVVLKPEDSCVPLAYSFWSGSDTIVYGTQEGKNFDDGIDGFYSKEVRCDLQKNTYITKSIADIKTSSKESQMIDINKVQEYYSYLSNKQRDKFSTHHRLKDGKQQTSDQIKSTYGNTEKVDLVDIRPVEGQDNTYTITIDLITKYAISRYINTKQVVISGDTRYIQNKDTIDSFHIPNLSQVGESWSQKESEIYRYNDNPTRDKLRSQIIEKTQESKKLTDSELSLLFDDYESQMHLGPYISEEEKERDENFDKGVFDTYFITNNTILFHEISDVSEPSCGGAFALTIASYLQNSNTFKISHFNINPESFFDHVSNKKLYKQKDLCSDYIENDDGPSYHGYYKPQTSEYFKTLITRFGKATEDMRKKSLGIE